MSARRATEVTVAGGAGTRPPDASGHPALASGSNPSRPRHLLRSSGSAVLTRRAPGECQKTTPKQWLPGSQRTRCPLPDMTFMVRLCPAFTLSALALNCRNAIYLSAYYSTLFHHIERKEEETDRYKTKEIYMGIQR